MPRRRDSAPQISRTMMAPITAPMMPTPLLALWKPRARPRKVPTKAPTMPRIVVITKPEGSLGPGVTNLAMTPASYVGMAAELAKRV